MACSFDIFAVVVSPETRNFFAQSPNIWKGLFLLQKCHSENSDGHLECLPDEPGVFLQINVSPEKPWKNKKLHLHPKEVFFKMFLRSLKFRFPHPCRKRLPTSGISSFKFSKKSQLFFSEKNRFVSKCFSRNMDCCFDKSFKIVSQRNRKLFPPCPKAKQIWFVTNFSAQNVPLYTWSAFLVRPDFIWSACGHVVVSLTPLVDIFAKSPELFH